MKKTLLKSVLVLGSLLVSQVNAALLLDRYEENETPSTVGGYAMTDFSLGNTGGAASSILSPITGSLNFEDINENPLTMDVGAANNLSWWENYETVNFNTYTTSVHWLKIILPANTLAFSFNIGANKSASGWLTAEDSHYMGLSNVNNNGVANFSVSTTYSPGFGIYADNSQATAGNCSYVSSVVIDPHLVWGVGNFSIAQGNCSSTVPEPSIIALLSFGLIGLGVVRRKMK